LNQHRNIIICRPDLPPESCPNIFPPPKPPKPPKKTKNIITDKICGNIYQRCNGEFAEYWRSIGISNLPFGSVSVVNKSDCIMTVRVDTEGDGVSDTHLFTITEKGQTKSVSLGTIANLEISCTGGENSHCSGSYCLSIHYEKQQSYKNEMR
jgi:hypothetical protein